MKKPKPNITFIKRKQDNGKFKIQRITVYEDGTGKKATIMKDLTSQAAKDFLFLKKRNKI